MVLENYSASRFSSMSDTENFSWDIVCIDDVLVAFNFRTSLQTF